MSPKSDRVGSDEPHDILAAKGFGVPAPDPDLHGDDPHDVLAAEEFPVPAGHRGHRHDKSAGVTAPRPGARLAVILAGLNLAAAIGLRRRRIHE